MSVFVLDSSVAAKWYQYEEHCEAARRLVYRREELHAPDFFLLEFDNILCKWMRRNLINVQQCNTIRRTIRMVPIHLHPWENLLDSAFDIANQTGRSLYDCLYLALAVYLDEPMVTADRKFHDAVADGPFASHVMWVENIP